MARPSIKTVRSKCGHLVMRRFTWKQVHEEEYRGACPKCLEEIKKAIQRDS